MPELDLQSTVSKSHNPRAAGLSGEGVMAEGGSVQVDPEVLDRMDRVRFRNGYVNVHIVLKDEYKPKLPMTERDIRKFKRLIEDIFDRVSDVVGEDPSDIRPNFEAVEMQGYRGACALLVRVRALDELLKQPEVSACLNWNHFPPETQAPPRELS